MDYYLACEVSEDRFNGNIQDNILLENRNLYNLLTTPPFADTYVKL